MGRRTSKRTYKRGDTVRAPDMDIIRQLAEKVDRISVSGNLQMTQDSKGIQIISTSLPAVFIKVIEGILNTDLVSGGSATMIVYGTKDGWFPEVPNRTETIQDRAGFFGLSGDYVMVFKFATIDEWRPIVMGCSGFSN